MLRERLAEQVEAVRAHAPKVYAYGDTRELHQLRVAVRRLRALLRTSAAIGDDARLESLRVRLGELARALGPARDADVFALHLREAADLGEPGLDRLIELVEVDRRRGYQEARAKLDDPSFLTLLEDLDDFCADAEIRDELLSDVLTAETRKLRKAMRATSTDGDLHEARIKAKRVRYTAEAAGRKETVERARRFQDVVGEHQDAVVAEQHLRELAEPDTAIVVGRLIERQAERRRRARRKLGRAWKRLAKTTG